MIPKDHWLRNRPIAHRGFQDINNGIVENTLESCALAIEKGYPIEIECYVSDRSFVAALQLI